MNSAGVTAVEATDLSMAYGSQPALDGVTFDVREGEIFGLLGHNGAGKTTAIRLLTGLLLPTRGQARVFGLDPAVAGKEVRARCGVSTETPSLDERMTGRAALAFFAELYSVPRDHARARIENLLDEFDLVQAAESRIGEYSKGMKQRLALARAILHDPELLFLDEPTSGLDPVAAREVNERVKGMSRQRNKTVILCTHNLVQAQQLCDRVAVLEHGRIVALGTPRELAGDLSQGQSVTLEVAYDDLPLARRLLADRNVTMPGIDEPKLEVEIASRDEIPALITLLAAEGVRLFTVEAQEPTLEDVYFALHSDLTPETA